MLHVIRSSAGAGKTHTLVKRWLANALASPAPDGYKHVLALTFTNKAAAEMRERILQYLEDLAAGGTYSHQLRDVADTIMAAHPMPVEEVAQRAAAALEHILHHWPQLAVTTIDAFTRRIVTPFTRDLKLDQDLEMTTEEQYYRERAVDLLLEDAGTDAQLTTWLMTTAEQLLEDEKAWRVDRPLISLSEQLGKEDALRHLHALRDVPSTVFVEARTRLAALVREHRERIRKAAREALLALASAGLTVDDLPYKGSGYGGVLKRLAEQPGRQEPTARALAALNNDQWTGSKPSPELATAIAAVAPAIRQAFELAFGDPDLDRRTVLADAIQRDLAPTATLSELDRKLAELKAADGVHFFSDLTRAVSALVREEPAPFIYERIGERYTHLMVDEFQDTSILQWHVLLPLVNNALANGGSVLLVGDAKQAIYRWRNGEVRQFVELPALFGSEDIADADSIADTLQRNFEAVPPLAGNYRSGRAIIHFNNALFGALGATLPPATAPIYAQHAQTPERDFDGQVDIRVPPEKADRDPDDPLTPEARFTVEAVQEARAAGFGPSDIAILVRTKSQGSRVAAALVAHDQAVVSQDGLALRNDPGALAVIHALAWAVDGDGADAALALQYHALYQARSPESDWSTSGNAPFSVIKELLHGEQDLRIGTPIRSLVVRIMDALGIHPVQDPFAIGLLQELHAWTDVHGDDPRGFIAHWQRVAKNASAATLPDATAVQVLTVHKSKGLQFPVVIVPYTEMASNANHGERAWVAPGELAPQLPAALVQVRKPLSDVGIPELDEETQRKELDALNLLYVAFTRPEQRLYAALPPKGKGWSEKIRTHLGLAPGERSVSGSPAIAPRKEREAPLAMELHDHRSRTTDRMALRLDAPQAEGADPAGAIRLHGVTVHAVLEAYTGNTDLRSAIAKALGHGADTPEAVDALTALLGPIVNAPHLATFFAPGAQVRTEATLIASDGRTFRPDRIVFDGTAVRVLDIKTGTAAESHHEQVRNYAQLLQEIGHPEVSAHLLYLPSGELVEVTV